MSENTLLLAEPRHISNSEVNAWLACQRKWFYAHSRNLAPQSYSTALNRGIIGHEILAAYYLALQNSASRADAEQMGRAVWMRYFEDDPTNTMLPELLTLLERYWKWCPERERGWEILQVETKYSVPLTDDYDYVMRLDLLIKDSTGEIIVVDHKFVYDFWTATGLDMNPQAPKYIAALRFNNKPVQRAMINMIRHRTLKTREQPDEDKFRRDIVKPMTAEIRGVLREQILASRQIIEVRGLTRQQQADRVLRNMSPYSCKTCSFVDLCKAELQGGDIESMIDVYFRDNDYNYNRDDDAIL